MNNSTKMKGYIYKVTNSHNNKVYIGQTNWSVNGRISSHLNSSKNINRSIYNSKFSRALRKYGIESFRISIEEELDCENRNKLCDQLNEREIYYILKYNSFFNGYNTTTGGKQYLFTIESKIKMSTNKRKLFNEEKKKNYSESKKGIKNSMFGISGINSPVSKPVSQFTKDGQYVDSFISATEASKKTGISQKNISCVCSGKVKLKSAGGYVWKYKNFLDRLVKY